MNKPLVVLGAGGHAAVLVDTLKQQNFNVLGLVSPELEVNRRVLQGIFRYLNDDEVFTFPPDKINLVNGLGSLPGNGLRSKLFAKFIALGYRFESIVSESAIVSPYAEIGHGVQVMSGVVIQAGAVIGANSIINTGAIIEHDCVIGANNHIAPGVTLSGEVKTEDDVHIGTGATVTQAVNIGAHVVIGSGACLTKNVEKNSVVYPAKIAVKDGNGNFI